ncbi:MAG TPA: hypothetical protein VI039_08600 [Solirubrobacterales bacterium]
MAGAPNLKEGRIYSWEQVATTFDFDPQYLGSVGGMVSRPQMNSLLLITHSQDGQSFSYGDEWDGEDLIYAGRGLTGDQELKGQNRQVAENSRELFLFEYGGRHQLLFHSRVRCVDYWQSTGFDKRGKERRVYRFRLRPLTSKKAPSGRRKRPKAPAETPPDSGRHRASFKPRPFDPTRSPTQRRRSAPADPESQKVLAEQADKAHQDTLSTFGCWLRENGWSGLEEIDGAIDLLANSRSRRVLFEIKSVRPGTERSRVRGGLAQLLEYRLFLGEPSDKLCLVSDRPISERRLRLLDSLSIGHAYVEDGGVKVSGTRSSRRLFK